MDNSGALKNEYYSFGYNRVKICLTLINMLFFN